MKSIVGYVMFTNVKNLPLTNKKTKTGICSWHLFCFVHKLLQFSLCFHFGRPLPFSYKLLFLFLNLSNSCILQEKRNCAIKPNDKQVLFKGWLEDTTNLSLWLATTKGVLVQKGQRAPTHSKNYQKGLGQY